MMNKLIILLAFGIFGYPQQEEVKKTIEIISSVEFTEHEAEYQGPLVPTIAFHISVINHTEKPIPDLEVTNRSKHLKFFVNGRDANPISLYNGLERTDVDHTIHKGDTASYQVMWVLSEGNGIEEFYGNDFYVHWTYMDLKSELNRVKLNAQTASEVSFSYLKQTKQEFNIVLNAADQKFRDDKIETALDLYLRANNILAGDHYVRAQIALCKEKLSN